MQKTTAQVAELEKQLKASTAEKQRIALELLQKTTDNQQQNVQLQKN